MAHDWGLVDELADAGGAVAVATGLATQAASMPPVATRMVKEAVNALSGALHKVGAYADADQSALSSATRDARAASSQFVKG